MDRQFYLDDKGNLKEKRLRGIPLGNIIGMCIALIVGVALLKDVARRVE